MIQKTILKCKSNARSKDIECTDTGDFVSEAQVFYESEGVMGLVLKCCGKKIRRCHHAAMQTMSHKIIPASAETGSIKEKHK
jgi:hypothetical protein